MKSNWSEQLLSKEQMARVSESVGKAESKTRGEIVPMIVRRSSAIGHVKIVAALIWLLLIATLDVAGTHYSSELTVLFYEKLALDFPKVLFWFTTVSALLAIPASYALATCAPLQRLLTPREDLEFEVVERAQLEFYWKNIQRTEERTGILIFLSLMERQCVVLADKGISSKLPRETWDGIVKTVVDGIKKNQASEGLIEAIQKCGVILAEHFPARDANPNELPNQLIVKE